MLGALFYARLLAALVLVDTHCPACCRGTLHPSEAPDARRTHLCLPLRPFSPQQDDKQELPLLEHLMRQPDAIMEPNVTDVMRRYITAGGQPATAVELLSDSYEGASPCTAISYLLLTIRVCL